MITDNMKLDQQIQCLFLHGLASNKSAVLNFQKGFENFNFPCFVPELPGHRYTLPLKNEVRECNWNLECETYMRYLTQNFKQKIIVSGQSFGSLLAMKIAIKYPELVKGLILFSPSLRLRDSQQDKLVSAIGLIPALIARNIGTIRKSSVSKHHVRSNEVYSINSIKQLGQFRREVICNLWKIKTPMFVVQSINDYHLCPTSSLIIKEKAVGAPVQIYLKDFGEIHNLNNLPQINGIIEAGLSFICQER